MSTVSNFTKKVLSAPELAQVSFEVAVLDAYLAKSDARVSRTRSVGRVKAPTWNIDFGIAPDEKTIHVTLNQLMQKLPEREREQWLQTRQRRALLGKLSEDARLARLHRRWQFARLGRT